MLKQVEYLASRLFQAGRRSILGKHLWGQLQQNHQRIGGALTGFLQALPARTDQGQNREQPGQAKGNPRQLAVAAIAPTQKYGMKAGWQNHLPASGAFLSMPELEQQPDKQRQDNQPDRA
ncbi:hypothetical protein D3C79_650450 [compost metagenome]